MILSLGGKRGNLTVRVFEWHWKLETGNHEKKADLSGTFLVWWMHILIFQ